MTSANARADFRVRFRSFGRISSARSRPPLCPYAMMQPAFCCSIKMPGLAKIGKKLLPNLSTSCRLKMIQAVCGHHGEPIDTGYRDLGNHKKTIGPRAQEAAVMIADTIVTLLHPPACSLEDKYVPLVSFWLAELTVLADWLGSNHAWFEFKPPPQSGDLFGERNDLLGNARAARCRACARERRPHIGIGFAAHGPRAFIRRKI